MRRLLIFLAITSFVSAAPLSPAAAQSTCSGHRDACLKACASARAGCTNICADAHAGCMRTGTWSGRLFQKSGLQKR